jgi:hypothetical protein
MMLKTKLFLAAVAINLAPGPLVSATLTTIPMQGGMVMPMLSYVAGEERLYVMMDAAVPQLTPLLVSHPEDRFDPADPWFDALDPTREGRSFSRRYGFVMDTMTDPLPAGRAIWIRKLSGSPELSVYRYASTEPKAFEPIFGTEGAPPARFWNGLMFHPVFTAPPGTNAFIAIFEACLVDTNTGTEIANSSTGPFVLNWTNIPDGRPELGIAQRIVISWPVAAANYVLEGAASLDHGSWTLVTNAPVLLDGESAVVLDRDEARKFFRMRLAP